MKSSKNLNNIIIVEQSDYGVPNTNNTNIVKNVSFFLIPIIILVIGCITFLSIRLFRKSKLPTKTKLFRIFIILLLIAILLFILLLL